MGGLSGIDGGRVDCFNGGGEVGRLSQKKRKCEWPLATGQSGRERMGGWTVRDV